MPHVLCKTCKSQDTRRMKNDVTETRASPWDIAERWYELTDVTNCVQRSKDIPDDVHSAEFARWLTHEYRLAMAKGVQLGRDGSEDRPIVSA